MREPPQRPRKLDALTLDKRCEAADVQAMSDDASKPTGPGARTGSVTPGPAPKVPARPSGERPPIRPIPDAGGDKPPAPPFSGISRSDPGPGAGEPIQLRASRRPAPSAPSFEKPSLVGAPVTLVALGVMAAIEAFLTLAQGFPGYGEDGIRRQVYAWFALRPIEPIAVWYGEAGPEALLGLVSHMLLHGGLMHLLFNGLVTMLLGPPIERAWGSARFLALALVCGVCGGLAHTGWELAAYTLDPAGDPTGLATPLVGASGAISGLIGVWFLSHAAVERARAPDEAGRATAFWNAVKICVVFLALNLSDRKSVV